MAKAKPAVEVPGEVAADQADQAGDETQSAASDEAETTAAPDSPLEKTEPQENEEAPAVVAQVSNDPKANTPLDWSHLSGIQAMQAPTPRDDPTANLPDMADVDPAKIPFARQVLTKQGWVVSTAPDPNARAYAGK